VTRAEASFFKKGERVEIKLHEVIESSVNGMKKLIEEKGLFIRTEGPQMSVRTYPEKLQIVLKNLLSNAYKFTSKGGIVVRWGKHRQNGAPGFHVAVEDTGRGITKDEISKVFERFYKGMDSGGRGLGLAIVKELTEVMGGKVEVESTLNQRTRFIVSF
jgi:signal transduction histidine kinase